MAAETNQRPPSEPDDWSKPVGRSLHRLQSLRELLGAFAAVVTALAAIIVNLLPGQDDLAKQIATIIALAAVVSGAGYYLSYYYRRRHLAYKRRPEHAAPAEERAALRFLLPFEDGDELPGRRIEVQELYTLLTSADFRFGLLLGESGCGKTSLVRAGLLPRLRAADMLPMYIPKTGTDPRIAIRAKSVIKN